jgi:hypothetical protein
MLIVTEISVVIMLLTFSKTEFEHLIKSGIKIFTIRQDRHNRWKEGMKIHFWMHNPRNIKMDPYPFGQGIVASVEPILLLLKENRIIIGENQEIDSASRLDQLAVCDGFKNWQEMKQWFQYDEFEGKLIAWRDCEWF